MSSNNTLPLIDRIRAVNAEYEQRMKEFAKESEEYVRSLAEQFYLRDGVAGVVVQTEYDDSGSYDLDLTVYKEKDENTHDFYSSYDYDLTCELQNLIPQEIEDILINHCEGFLVMFGDADD
jgi:hypothetical protein